MVVPLKLCVGQYINPNDIYYIIIITIFVSRDATIIHKMY